MRRRQVLKATAGLAAVAALARPSAVSAVTGYDAGDRGAKLEKILKRMGRDKNCRGVILETTEDAGAYTRCYIDSLIITDLLVTAALPGDTLMAACFESTLELCVGVRWAIDEEHVGQVVGRTRVKGYLPPVIEHAVLPRAWAENNRSMYRWNGAPA